MISYIPEIYPDELVYSWFCRLYIHAGYLTHKAAISDLFEKRSCNPSKEFIGYLNTDAKSIISRVIPIKELVIRHTMFPQYARFISTDKKATALKLLGEGSTDPHRLLTILPRNQDGEWLRYCPLCVNEDRQRYGEAYWHRFHQIRNIILCPKHKCCLISSAVSIKSENTFAFYPAETNIAENKAALSQNELSEQFTDYCFRLFTAPIALEKDIPVSGIIYSSMKAKGYISSTGRCRYTKRLYEDITDFYSGIAIQNRITFAQLQRALLDNLREFTTITQIAFFLGISVEDLAKPTVTDAEVSAEQASHYMKGVYSVNWSQLDNETAPILEKLAHDIYNGVNGRPERVSEKMICRKLGLLSHQLENMPKCLSIYKKYAEPYGSAWARKVVWAYDRLLKEHREEPFYWSDIRALTGVKKSNFDRVKPFLPKFTTPEKTAAIIELIK